MDRLKLLAVFAHPDDESFGIGGTLAKYAAAGFDVGIVSATRGEAGIPGLGAAEAARIRESELRAAAARLGASGVYFLDYVDGTLADVDQDEAIGRLLALLQMLRPHVLITFGPDGITGHPDHVAVGRWVTAACAALSGPNAPQRLYYVAPSLATEQGCGVANPPPLPADAIGIDVDAHLVTKVRAMQAHASQNPPYPGDPVQEAKRLDCHEWYVLSHCRPSVQDGQGGDLFAGLS